MALRRASIHLKNRGLSSGTTRVFSVKSEIERCYLENYNTGMVESQGKRCHTLVCPTRLFNTSSSSSKFMEVRSFSSHAGAKSTGEEDDALEDGFSELETPDDVVEESVSLDEIGDESVSESELSEDIQNELDVEEKKPRSTFAISAITKAILDALALPVNKVLDKWVESGNEVTRAETSLAMFQLRKRRLFAKALQLSEWLESSKHLEFVEKDYASRVDLIAKVRGISKAEAYLQQIPEHYRGELAYRTLLANCVATVNVKKAEEIFYKMRSLFPLTCFTCNQLLILYKRTDKKKIADILKLMEKENIRPSPFTYQILIAVKGQTNDMEGMEKIVETMKAEGLEPNSQIKTALARYYAFGGLKDKAEAVLKEMEGDDLTKNRWCCRFMLPVYATLGREDEVSRIWKICESNPRLEESLAAIQAWGQLSRVEDAEAAFNKILKKMRKPSSGKPFAALLRVYADNKMLAKGKDLIKQMGDKGFAVGPLTWDALVQLYVGAGEVEKADSILDKAIKKRKGRPLFSSYNVILDQYAKRGDIHNAEKIFLKLREAGYVSRVRPFQSLLYAYVKAKTPAYGFTERMKADNLFPNRGITGLLAQVNVFKKTEVDELLD